MNKKLAEKEEEYEKAKHEADRARKERDVEEEKEKKKLESMKNELTAFNNKLEKLTGKKEKLETGVIADLQEQLKEAEHELEKAEMDSYANILMPAVDRHKPTVDDLVTATPDPKLDHSHSLPYLSTQRMRHQTIPTGTIGRPSLAPIQRPSEAHFGHQPELWTHPVSPRLSHTTHQTHNHRSSSLHHQTPILLTNPQRRKSSASTLPHSPIRTNNPSSPTSQSTVSIAVPTSTLSSKAPAFEPGRPVKTANVNATTRTGVGPSSMPIIQRPSAVGTARGVPMMMGVHTPASQWAGVHGHFDGGRIG
jgi:hypothetical protein